MRDEIPLAISDNDYVTFGSGFSQILVTCVGLLAALAMADSAPTVWMIPLGGLVLGIIALVFIGLANITSMIAIFYGMAVALRQGGGVWMHLPWRRLDQRALYDTSATGKYSFCSGWNYTAFAAIAVGAVVYYALLDPQTLAPGARTTILDRAFSLTFG